MKKAVRAQQAAGVQYAALPFRIQARQVQILLITSRGTKRWVIPKGWPMTGLKPHDAAAIEAAEEAGIIGEIEPQAFGAYTYEKRLTAKRSANVQVAVFPFRVQAQADDWKEHGQRMFDWFAYRQAAMLVAEPSLRQLIRDFGAERSPSLLARSLRTYRNWRMSGRG